MLEINSARDCLCVITGRGGTLSGLRCLPLVYPWYGQMKSMEQWKLVLAWGCLILFFAFPFATVLIHLSKVASYPQFAAEFKYLGEYMKTIAVIVISLAGFSTAEIFKKP
jgi:hypothetical protein